MIYDTLEHLLDYADFLPALRKVDAIIKQGNLLTAQTGRHTIDDNLYYNIEEYQTTENPKPFEVHHRYADVQIVLKGEETHQTALRSAAENLPDFDDERDIAFFHSPVAATFYASAQHFLIYLPFEPHRSQMAVEKVQSVRKVVFKIRL